MLRGCSKAGVRLRLAASGFNLHWCASCCYALMRHKIAECYRHVNLNYEKKLKPRTFGLHVTSKNDSQIEVLPAVLSRGGCQHKILQLTSLPQEEKGQNWLSHGGGISGCEQRGNGHSSVVGNALCIFCDQAAETMDHIILGCVFSREVWNLCLSSFWL